MNTLIALLSTVIALAFAPQQSGDSGAVSPADCPPFPLSPAQRTPLSYAPFESYANAVIGATDVINPDAVVGPEDINFAYMTATSVLTLSFPAGGMFSGIAVVVINDAPITCDYLWMTVKHYADLTQTPLATTTTYSGIWSGGWGPISEGWSLHLPFHRYVVVSFNTNVYVDAAYFLIRPTRYWLPVISRSSVP